MAGPTHQRDPEDAVLFAPVLGTTHRFWLSAGPLLALTLWGIYAYTLQLRYGLGVTGLNRPVAWGSTSSTSSSSSASATRAP